MGEGMGLFVIWTDVAPEAEAEFNEWYNSEHLPQLLGVPGFLAGRRYQAVEGAPRYITIYDLGDADVYRSAAFLKIRESSTPWTKKMIPQLRDLRRAAFRRIFSHGDRPAKDAEFVLTVRLNTPADHERDFNAWYNEDHIPALASVKGVYCARRYEAIEGDPKYLAVYEMNDPAVAKTPAWEVARKFGRTREIRPYLRDLHTVVARRIFPA
jgi:hypothetical protein